MSNVESTRCSAEEATVVSIVLCDDPERRESEQKLRESGQRFRDLFELAPVGMYLAGADGQLIQVNAAFCRMLGYSEQELLGKTWEDLSHPDEMTGARRQRETRYHQERWRRRS